MSRHRMNELFDRYERTRLPQLGERTRKDYRRFIKMFRQEFGSSEVDDVTPDTLRKYMDVEKGKIQRNRHLATLSTVFDYGVRWKLAKYNPCTQVERHESKPHDRLVSDKELEGIKRSIGKNGNGDAKRMALAVDLARLTGIPQGELI